MKPQRKSAKPTAPAKRPAQPPAKSSRLYSAHRERQRRRILNAAQELFESRGIDRVTMAEIVKVTGVRPTTVYEYFANKDQIVWALLEEYFTDSIHYIAERTLQVSGSALEKLTALLEAFAQELIDHPHRVRFQAQFDAMYAREWSADQLLAVEEKIVPGRSKDLADLIREGIRDGSLCSDLNPELTIYSIINSAIATQRRLASLAGRAEKEYGQPIQSLFREAMRLILLGVRKH